MPCGFHNDRTTNATLYAPIDSALQSRKYRAAARRSNHIDIPAVNYKEWRSTNEPEKFREDSGTRHPRPKFSSRATPSGREKLYCQCQMSPGTFAHFWRFVPDCERLLERAMTKQGLRPRTIAS